MKGRGNRLPWPACRAGRGDQCRSQRIRFGLVFSIVAVLSVNMDSRAQQAPKSEFDKCMESVIRRWDEINDAMPEGDLKDESVANLEDLKANFASKRRPSSRRIKELTGFGKLGPWYAETRWKADEKKPGWVDRTEIRINKDKLCKLAELISTLCGYPPGGALEECVKTDLLVIALVHELHHVWNDTGNLKVDPGKVACWEYGAMCKNQEHFDAVKAGDPAYAFGGAKACAGMAFDIFIHDLKERWGVLKPPAPAARLTGEVVR